MIEIKNKENCCGCTACVSACAHKAINMQPDELGFLYPIVDLGKCIDCGLCEKVCSFNEHYEKSSNLNQPLFYAARHKDLEEVMKSRSGASFVAFSDKILAQGGVIYGVGYHSHFVVSHKRATTLEERDEFRGSRYVQSNLEGIFLKVKQDLKSGKKVLFSGTPCQTAGLASFIGSRLRKNLFLVDIICHGVPSPKLWSDYLSYQEHKYHATVTKVDFRNKVDFGWDDHRETLWFGKKKRSFNIYTHFFYLDTFLRDSCFDCKFCNLQRPSDITIGDFWKLTKSHPELNSDNKGYSLLIVNTEKGKGLLNACSDKLFLTQCDANECMQRNLQAPTQKSENREKVIECYLSKGFSGLMKEFGNIGLKDRLRDKKVQVMKKLGFIDWR